ncbi:MAG: hypothetical protein WDN03_15705 [Rhizomicrobium sp.]
MREPAQNKSSTREHRVRAAVRSDVSVEPRQRKDAPHARPESPAVITTNWRRIEMGTNPIACFGIWRRGTRRQAERVNRARTTRWRLPHRSGAAFVQPGAVHDIAVES